MIFLANCNPKNEKDKNHYVIPLAENISNLNEIKCSSIIDQFEYIQLETNEKCLIPNEYQVIILRNHILIYSVRFCYVFERKTGKFLCELGKYGRGPEEYNNSLLAYDYGNSVVYSGGSDRNIMMFGLDGKYIRSFPGPPQKGGMEAPSLITHYSYLPDSCIVGYYSNILGIETKLLTIFNQKGEIIKTFPNKNVYPKQPLKMLDLTEGQFYFTGNNTYFKERSCDTVFRVRKESLSPHLIFETGKYTVPYQYKWMTFEEREKGDYIIVNKIFENSSFVYILAEKKSDDYFAFYNKRTGKIAVNRNVEGIPNDIDNFISFNPENMDEDGNLVEIIDATKISIWFKENPSKISERTEVLSKVDISQNPIVVIGKTNIW
ncbi:MAG: 6-bladed beta-propeller [Bacteroidales bacterium]|nr:6-bladed beta-propeller [Bacteroidales bacterium]